MALPQFVVLFSVDSTNSAAAEDSTGELERADSMVQIQTAVENFFKGK